MALKSRTLVDKAVRKKKKTKKKKKKKEKPKYCKK